LGSVKIEVISTPGHTPGNLSFFFPYLELLFIGDYDLTRFGPWYGDTYSSIEDTIDSVTYLRNLQAKYLIASHEEGVFLNPSEKLWEDYLNIINERERKLLDLLEKPRTLNEIVGAWIVYGRPREPKAFFEFGERALMKKHLERLMKSGAVVKENDRYIKI
jgi:glyoxylase-like metal-dependent hydrolase (beta-lactamase superfamily II)